MESGKIKDSQITASSVWDDYHGASNARLNFVQKSGSWSSRSNDLHQWLQVDFKYEATITAIQTQGRGSYGQWVKSYTLSYSDDGVKFKRQQQKQRQQRRRQHKKIYFFSKNLVRRFFKRLDDIESYQNSRKDKVRFILCISNVFLHICT